MAVYARHALETIAPTVVVRNLVFHDYPHPHGKTAKRVYKGAAGMFIIDHLKSQSLNIPQTYGVDDIPLIIQDKRFI